MGMGGNNYLSVSQIQIRIEEFPYSLYPIFNRWGFFVFKVFIVNIDYNGRKIYKDTFRGY